MKQAQQYDRVSGQPQPYLAYVKYLVQSGSVVTETNFSVGFRLLGHNRNPDRPKFLKLELSVVINTSFLALFVEFLLFISSKTTQRIFF